MSQGAIVLLIVAIVVIAIVVALAVAFSRKSRLRGLPDESREKYARSWHGVENRFIEDPTGAVNEADRMVVMMLSERGATLSDPHKVPDELRQAREAAASDRGREGTEGMRMALVHYKKLVDDSVGATRMKREDYRREVAS
ncbi:MAG TPA: hypothetical protein VFL27_04170 [Candidatus Dormibacteraeota bacterium]|nr:hypothetical protein [Candidatus Dormibacteraeota bacterium]